MGTEQNGANADLVERFLDVIDHQKPIWWYTVALSFWTSSQDPEWSTGLAAIEAARSVSAELWASVPKAVLQAARRPRRDALLEPDMANAAIEAAIAAASALAVKDRLVDRTFRVLYAPFEALVPVRSLSHSGLLRIA